MASSPHPLPFLSFVLLTDGPYCTSVGRFIGYYGGPTPYTIAPHSAVWLPDVDVVVVPTVFLQLIRAISPPDDLNNQRIGALLCRRVGCKSTGGVAPKKQIAISNLLQVYYDSDSSDDSSSLE
jgi:hypothetical protein